MTLGSMEPIIQKDASDCGIASAAMAISMPYRVVSEAALKICKRPHKLGMHVEEIERIARAFGVRFRQAESAEDVTGLLVVERGKGRKRECHVAALFEGVVVNPADGLLWNLDSYLSTGKWTVGIVLERVT